MLPAVGQRESQAEGLALRDSDGWGPVSYKRDQYVVVSPVWYISVWNHVMY